MIWQQPNRTLDRAQTLPFGITDDMIGPITTFFARLACLMGRHERLRESVRRDGLYRTGQCKTCGIAMRRRDGYEWEVCAPKKGKT